MTVSTILDRLGGRSAILRGAAWMTATAFGFAAVLAAVRDLSATLPTFELVFLRNLIGLAIAAPAAMRCRGAPIRTRKLGLHGLRALFTYFGMLASFYALSRMPLADASALQFLIPLFAMLGAALVLREPVVGPRLLAAAVGFAGALVIIRPGFAAFDLAALIMVASSACYAAEWIVVRVATRTESAAAIVFHLNLLMLPASLAPALLVWVTPSLGDLPALLALGLVGWFAIFAQARAVASAETSVIMPFDFLRLPFAALLAFVLFDEVPDHWTWVGAAIIFASAYCLVRRESGRGS
jgi:drug/metabolite transporter (DMT)-like permease